MMLTFTFPFVKTDARVRRLPEVKGGPSDLGDHLDQARKLLSGGNPEQALAVLSPYLSEDPVPAGVQLLAGRALYSMGRHHESLIQLEAHVSQHPGSVEGLIFAGLAAARIRELARAINWFNGAALALSPRQRSLLKNLGAEIHPDPVALEEMMADAELNRGDRDLALVLACALGQAGHFKAAERYLWVFDLAADEVSGE
jgi:tetratricopeptide (TPR) repeat protein